MNSEHNDATSYQQSEPKLCSNNCGFYGNPSTMNLCSKCYRDLSPKQDPSAAAEAKSAMEEISLNYKSVAVFENTKNTPTSISSDSSAAISGGEPPKAASRCRSCNKKVRWIGFVCKCGNTFCGDHRLPEKHECSYDFKRVGRDAIAKANPLIKADKIHRF